ncbi:MAG: UDP-N-acetylmuramate dehydrogenase, partial [Thermoleophilaceae bacterium]
AAIGALTTLRVGGAADRMATVESTEELVAALELGRDAAIPAGVLGKGSDIVVADAGVRGLVIRNRASSIDLDGRTVEAGSGAAMAALVKRCTAAGLAGIEFGISIPGSVGGAVWANAGAHGGEMRDIVQSVSAWSNGGVVSLSNDECAFAYRESRFKRSGEVVLAATLGLAEGDPAVIERRVAADQAQRRATQPLGDQNAGSIFRNPSGDHAGRLVDVAGLKGFRIGSASVSTVHANFIVVDRGGSAADVRAVGEHARAVVADRFGVELQYEVEFVGEWPASLDPAASSLAGVR